MIRLKKAVIDRVILALRRDPKVQEEPFQNRLEELQGLAEASGAVVVAVVVQERAQPDSSVYLGTGKVEEIADAVQESQATAVIFGEQLTPAQVRNLEGRLQCSVLDRTQLILDIFALRARSKEGRLQVEIAQLQYLLPRLTGRGVELSRLGGGIGTRGPGETKLETDRRRIRQRISHLRAQLKKIERRRQVQRDKRSRSVTQVAFVGYTNAGKTTLLKRWTHDKGITPVDGGHSRLFDTLDPLARRVQAGNTSELVLLDTVGFVENLPHLLIEAFRATLEEVLSADLIVHVVDATADPSVRLETTYHVLGEIGAMDKPIVTFFNKMDAAKLHPGPDVYAAATVYGSAKTGMNIEELYRTVEKLALVDPVELVVEGRPESPAFWNDISKMARILETSELEDHSVRVKLAVDRRDAKRLTLRLGDYADMTVEFAQDVGIDDTGADREGIGFGVEGAMEGEQNGTFYEVGGNSAQGERRGPANGVSKH
ncbi:GTPase HflX [Alicyclobacillus tolerans]|uniref:GTPase HflX n=1 Tax=Alicyclobacillus tolerans TaxID=90970 RepID=UPI001F009A3C|nr:GTPase HflX [Alicyclobacillus tolerans]MCF8566961.1 GTPase HflX [Alicyclobacillus tolerans]